jgi:hypothetical protein
VVARALAAVALLLLSGCLHGTFHPTPCAPAGAATYGAVRVQVPTTVGDGDRRVSTVGKCVALEVPPAFTVVATARIGADGNASLPLPVQGDLHVEWREPQPHDTACAHQGTADFHAPGTASVVLTVGGLCY